MDIYVSGENSYVNILQRDSAGKRMYSHTGKYLTIKYDLKRVFP